VVWVVGSFRYLFEFVQQEAPLDTIRLGSDDRKVHPYNQVETLFKTPHSPLYGECIILAIRREF
jgi:hypothetical protein